MFEEVEVEDKSNEKKKPLFIAQYTEEQRLSPQTTTFVI